jgi:hypothetical protein
VIVFGRILNRECDLQGESRTEFSRRRNGVSSTTHLNERVKRLPIRPLEILPGLEYDLVSPRLKPVRFRLVGREEVQTPPVCVRDGGPDSDPHPRAGWGGRVGVLDARSEELDLDALSWLAER